MTPAMFMVSALVFPISMNTLMLRPKAAAALDTKMGISRRTCKAVQHAGCDTRLYTYVQPCVLVCSHLPNRLCMTIVSCCQTYRLGCWSGGQDRLPVSRCSSG